MRAKKDPKTGNILKNGDAPDSMKSQYAVNYRLHNRDADGNLDDDAFDAFLEKIIAFIWTYAMTNKINYNISIALAKSCGLSMLTSCLEFSIVLNFAFGSFLASFIAAFLLTLSFSPQRTSTGQFTLSRPLVKSISAIEFVSVIKSFFFKPISLN